MIQQVNDRSALAQVVALMVFAVRITVPALIAAAGVLVGLFFLGSALTEWNEAFGLVIAMGLSTFFAYVTFMAVAAILIRRLRSA